MQPETHSGTGWRRFMRLALGLVLGIAVAASVQSAPRDPLEHFFQPFLGDLREELQLAASQQRRGVVVMYHFDECPACQRMKATVLNQPAVQGWYRRHFIVLGVDTRGAQPITGLDGRQLPEREYARALSIRGTPTFDFYAPDGAHVYRHVGGLFVPEAFLALGEFVISGGFRTGRFSHPTQGNSKGK